MNLKVKLINGFWMAEVNGRLEKYSELPPTLKKLYNIVFKCELITSKL